MKGFYAMAGFGLMSLGAAVVGAQGMIATQVIGLVAMAAGLAAIALPLASQRQ